MITKILANYKKILNQLSDENNKEHLGNLLSTLHSDPATPQDWKEAVSVVLKFPVSIWTMISLDTILKSAYHLCYHFLNNFGFDFPQVLEVLKAIVEFPEQYSSHWAILDQIGKENQNTKPLWDLLDFNVC
ncbi:MAG: hypothetical protein K0S74_1758 [Chlamydiales bacterium]|nr:hypothetical protein [Chlamydiales bacterium]